jgi:hypothetical protein
LIFFIEKVSGCRIVIGVLCLAHGRTTPKNKPPKSEMGCGPIYYLCCPIFTGGRTNIGFMVPTCSARLYRFKPILTFLLCRKTK